MSSTLGDILFTQFMKDSEDLSSDVTLKAADNLSLGKSLFCTAKKVTLSSIVIAHTDDHYPMEGSICLPVAATV